MMFEKEYIYIDTVATRRRKKKEFNLLLPIYCIIVLRIIIRFSNWYTSYIKVSHMKIAVIGAGPAGILLVAEAYLQCKKNNQNDTIIYWYDKEHFLSGMMDKYQVPSNTKMDYLDQGLGFFTESPIGPLAKLFPEIVPLVGFEINKLPEIIINDNETINNKDLIFKAKTTELFYKGTSIGFEMGASRPEYYTDHPKFKYPIIALRGGEETKRKGWSGEYPVGWALFRLRAIQIVKAILGNDNIMNDKEASTIAKL